MGKVSFPLINVRKDAAGSWHPFHYTGKDQEEIEVPSVANEFGFFSAYLTEVPDSGSAAFGTRAPQISGFVEFRGNLQDPNSLALALSPNQFYVNYTSGELVFHPSQAGKKFYVDYYGKGSLIEADDFNALHSRLETLELEKDVPQFTDFKIRAGKTIYEVGETFPTATLPATIDFIWSTFNAHSIQPDTVEIFDETAGAAITSSPQPDNGLYTVVFPSGGGLVYNAPTEVVYKIVASDLVGNQFDRKFSIRWVDRIFFGTCYGITPTTGEITASGTKLLDSITDPFKEIVSLAPTPGYHKFFAIPDTYDLKSAVDVNTSLSFVFNAPIIYTLSNAHGLNINYKVYVSSNPISSSVDLECTFGV